MLKEILQRYPDDNLWTADGYDAAIIGVDEESMRLVYSVRKIIEILSADMPEFEAEEFCYYNIVGSKGMQAIFCEDYF